MVTKIKAGNKWFIDKDSEYRFIYHKVRGKVLVRKTRFQRAEFIDTYDLGRIVVLDDRIQSSEADEFIYHEALVHPVMVAYPEPVSILILGGGEGVTLREVLRHPTVEKVIMIDIDKEFVNLCKSHLGKWHKGSFNDERVKLLFSDAKKFIKETKLRFDVVIADISDPVEEGPASSLYKKEFYSLLKRVLTPDGIFVTHATEVHYTSDKSISTRIFKTLADIFPVTEFYYEYIPSYSSLWSFIVGSLKYGLKEMSSNTLRRRLKERRLENLSYYDPETHKRLFCLPKNVRSLLNIQI